MEESCGGSFGHFSIDRIFVLFFVKFDEKASARFKLKPLMHPPFLPKSVRKVFGKCPRGVSKVTSFDLR